MTPKKAERAMRRAVELAPAYAYPRWFSVIFFCAAGRRCRALVELRRASDAYDGLRPQVFSLAWQVYPQSPNELTSAIGPTVSVRAEFARYLIDSGQLDEGLKVWNGLNANEKKESQEYRTGDPEVACAITDIFTGYSNCGTISRLKVQSGSEWTRLSMADARRISPADSGPFGWQVKSTRPAQVTFDTANHHGGAHSVRILFQAPGKVEFNCLATGNGRAGDSVRFGLLSQDPPIGECGLAGSGSH